MSTPGITHQPGMEFGRGRIHGVARRADSLGRTVSIGVYREPVFVGATGPQPEAALRPGTRDEWVPLPENHANDEELTWTVPLAAARGLHYELSRILNMPVISDGEFIEYARLRDIAKRDATSTQMSHRDVDSLIDSLMTVLNRADALLARATAR